jgi:hypothetical protein
MENNDLIQGMVIMSPPVEITVKDDKFIININNEQGSLYRLKINNLPLPDLEEILEFTRNVYKLGFSDGSSFVLNKNLINSKLDESKQVNFSSGEVKTDIFKQDDKYQVIMSNDSQAFYVGKPFDTYDDAEIYENNLIKFLSSHNFEFEKANGTNSREEGAGYVEVLTHAASLLESLKNDINAYSSTSKLNWSTHDEKIYREIITTIQSINPISDKKSNIDNIKFLENEVFEALGEVSMCWSETPKGEFDSNKAQKIGEKLMNVIKSTFHVDEPIISNPEEKTIELSSVKNEYPTGMKVFDLIESLQQIDPRCEMWIGTSAGKMPLKSVNINNFIITLLPYKLEEYKYLLRNKSIPRENKLINGFNNGRDRSDGVGGGPPPLAYSDKVVKKREQYKKEMDEVPRRNRLDLCSPAELACYKAMQEVESMGADLRLTDAITKLNEARNHIADFVDEQACKPPIKSETDSILSVEIDGNTYWVDTNFEWEDGKWYSIPDNEINAINYFNKIEKGNLIVFDYKEAHTLFQYHYHSPHNSHAACMGKPYLIIAQSKPFLKNIPLKSLTNEVECDFCDGCGWYEGGKALKTTCEKCNGTGKITK